MRLLLLSTCALIFSACSGSSSSGSEAESLSAEITYHENGEIASQGMVDGDRNREGVWTWYHDNAQAAVEVSFKNNQFQDSAEWILFNPDGSIKADHTDGISFVFDKPWEQE